MQVVTVEVLNENVLKLLEELEQLKMLRFLPKTEAKQKTQSPKRKWAGSISNETAEKMLIFTQNLRNEWERT